MQKAAFIPTVLLPIKSREEYDSKIGRGKRELNEALSASTGAAIGGGAGYGIGHLTGRAFDKKHPSKLGVSTRVFEHMGDKSKFNPISKYIRGYRKHVGMTPKTIPYVAYAPAVLGIYGALGGMLTSEYKTIKRMEQQAGISPQITKGDYLKREVVPAATGVAAGMVAADAIGSVLQRAKKNKLTGAGKLLSIIPAVGIGAGAGIITESIIEKKMKDRVAKKPMEKSAYFRLGQILPKNKTFQPMRDAAAGVYHKMRKTPMGADAARLIYDKAEIIPHHLITGPLPVYPTTLMDGVLAIAGRKTRAAKVRTFKSMVKRTVGKAKETVKGIAPDANKVNEYLSGSGGGIFDGYAQGLDAGSILAQYIR